MQTPPKSSPRRGGLSKPLKIFLIILTVAATSLAIFWDKLPFDSLAERKIKQTLQSFGVTVNDLTVSQLTQTNATLTNIAVEYAPVAATIDELQATYTPRALLDKQISTLSLTGATITNQDATTPAFTFPFNATASLENPENITLTLSSSSPTTTVDNYKISAKTLNLNATANLTDLLNPAAKGTLTLKDLIIKGLPQDIPPLSGSTTFTANKNSLTTNTTLSDKTNAWKTTFTFSGPTTAPESGTLTIASAQFPWEGGTITLDKTTIPLAGSKPIPIALTLKNIPLDRLLNTATEGKVEGTGIVNGTIPLTSRRDGTIILGEGSAQALDEGTLSVSPDALPGGDNQHMQIVRTALANFHYTSLQIHLSSDAENKPVIKLTVEGNNPEAFDGRPVKLNVNLTGDLLPLLQQSVLPINDVKQLLKEK